MKQFLTDLSVMDNFNNILDYPKFIKVNNQLRQNTEDVYKITGMGNPFLVSDVDETKAIPNEKLFEKIDDRRKQLGLYEDRLAGNKGNSTIIGEVNYKLRALEILQSDKGSQVFEKGAKNGWPLEKILTELAIPKDQKDIILGLGIKNRDQIIIELATQYSFAVKIDTAQEWHEELSTIEDHPFLPELQPQTVRKYYNTRHYAELNVPGGTNYTENEIATPLITPSIKGHAQFATDKGIGWFRGDDKTVDELKGNWIKSESELPNEFIYSGEKYFKENGEWQTKNRFIEDIETVIWRYNMSLGNERIQNKPETKTRRILEVQSDIFQKSRDIKSPDEIINELKKSGELQIKCD